jgi:hypothetical protein
MWIFKLDMGCNKFREALRVVYASMSPVAFAALTLYAYQSSPLLSGVLAMSYIVWGWHKISKPVRKVCSPEAWRYTSWLFLVGFMATVSIYLYIGHLLNTTYGHIPILFMPLESMALTVLIIASSATTLFLYVVVWAKMSPSAEQPPPQAAHAQPPRVQGLHTTGADASSGQGLADGSGDVCKSLRPHHRRLLCDGEIVETEENDVLAVAAYYHMLHRRDLNVAREMLNVLRSRNLDEKEKAALEVLEIAYDAATDPPCSPQRLLLYMDKLWGVEAAGWALLLKTLVSMHISGADQDYVEGVKQWMQKAAKSGICGTDVCRFAYNIIDRITPLCPKNAPSTTLNS